MKKCEIMTLFCIVSLMFFAGCKKESKPGQLESIRFKSATYTIAENQDINLRNELETVPAGLNKTAKIQWNVNDENVAEMSGAFLVPKRAGDVKITATIDDKSANCNVTITNVPIDDITLKDFTVNINGTVNAEEFMTIIPEGINPERLNWSISNENIASVDKKGSVKGLKEGNATITVEGDDITRTCNVSVKKVPVSEVKLSETEISFITLGDTKQLSATVKPDNASYPDVKWESSNNLIASVENGLVKCISYGEATITAIADGVKSTCKVVAYEAVKDCQGNIYRTTKIGNQTWMAENLKCYKYDTNSEMSGELPDPVKATNYICQDPLLRPWITNEYAENIKSEHEAKFGYVYSWNAAVGLSENTSRTTPFTGHRQGICPNGWHIPTEAEFSQLKNFIGAGAGKRLKNESGWHGTGSGTDSYSFAALPVGRLVNGQGYMFYVGRSEYFWSATPHSEKPGCATSFNLYHDTDNPTIYNECYKSDPISVRCLKN